MLYIAGFPESSIFENEAVKITINSRRIPNFAKSLVRHQEISVSSFYRQISSWNFLIWENIVIRLIAKNQVCAFVSLLSLLTIESEYRSHGIRVLSGWGKLLLIAEIKYIFSRCYSSCCLEEYEHTINEYMQNYKKALQVILSILIVITCVEKKTWDN